MPRFTKLTALALTALLALSAASRASGPLDERVPQDAIVYFGWAGSDALQAPYAASNLKGIVDASTARDFITQQLPKLIDLAAKADPQAPQIIERIQTGMGLAWHHPTAFYFCPIDFTNIQQPEFRAGLLCDAGADAKTLSDLLTEALAKVPPQKAVPINVAMDGTLVSLTVGKPQLAADRLRNGTLSANPVYVKAMGHLKLAKPAFAVYVDFAKILAMANDGLSKAPDLAPAARTKVAAVIDLLGLNGMTQMASVNGFDGKEWAAQSFLGISGEPKGLLTLLGGQPLSDSALIVIPKDAITFSTLKFDPHQIFTDVRTAIGKVDEPTLKQLDDALTQAGQIVGVNLERDVLAPLGDEWIIYRAPLSDLGGNSFAMVHKLRDADRFAKTLVLAEGIANRAGEGRFKIDKMTSSKIEFSAVTFLQYSVAWTVRNGYLYVSSMEGIPGAVKQVENKLPSIAESDLFRKALASVAPAGIKPASISYANPAKLYPELRRNLLGLLPLARMIGIDLPAGLLPDAETIAPLLTPGVSISWWDADGLHQSSHTSFPGAEILGGSPGGPVATVAIASMGTAVLLPSLGRARVMAKRTADASDLKALSIGIAIFQAENNNRFPDDLARLVANGSVPPKVLISPLADTAPLVMTPDLEKLAKDDFPKFSEQVAQHCDFIYSAKGAVTDAPFNIVIAYDKPGLHLTDGMNLAFADGHVEFVRWPSLALTFSPTNDRLKKMGLPEIDIQEILAKSGAAAFVLPPAPVIIPRP